MLVARPVMGEQRRDMLSEIGQQTPAICNLLGLWRSFLRGGGVLAPASPADDLNGRMLFQPGANCLDRAVRQQIDWFARFQITDQRARAQSALGSPIVNANDPGRVFWPRHGRLADQAEKTRRACWQTYLASQARSCFSPQRQSELLQRELQAGSSLGVRYS